MMQSVVVCVSSCDTTVVVVAVMVVVTAGCCSYIGEGGSAVIRGTSAESVSKP